MSTGPNIEIHHSTWRMLSLLAASASFVVLSGAMAVRAMPGVTRGSFIEFIGYAGVLVFGAACFFILRQWLTAKGPVVTLTQTGIRDVRLAAEEIPWTAISNLAMWEYQRQKSLVLSVDPDVEAGLTLTRTARWTREPNRSLGVDGLCVAATGLDMDFPTLVQHCSARYHAAKRETAPPAAPGASDSA